MSSNDMLMNSMKTGLKMLVLGRSGAGKTVTVFEIVKALVQARKVNVKHVILFSKTVRSDPTQVEFVQWASKQYKGDPSNNEDTYAEQNTSESVNVPFLKSLFESQKQLKDNGKRLKPWLVVFDDLISEGLLRSKDQTMIDLATIGRHYCIHSIWLLQSYRSAINPLVRRQCNCILLGQMSSAGDVDDILAEYSGGVPGETKRQRLKWMQTWYDDAVAHRSNHGFLKINTENAFGEGRYQQCCTNQYYDVS